MNNKAFSKIWIVAIVVILITGGIFAWQYFGALKEKIKAPEEKIEEVASEEVIKDETADWKTYRNEKYGFEIKYPNDWITSEAEECGYQFRRDFKTVVHFKPESFEIGERYICIDVTDNEKQLSLKQFFENQKREIEENGYVVYFPFVDLKPTETFVVKNYTFYNFWIPGVIGTVNAFTSNKNHIFNIYSYEGKEEFFAIKNQIISTFRFIEN